MNPYDALYITKVVFSLTSGVLLLSFISARIAIIRQEALHTESERLLTRNSSIRIIAGSPKCSANSNPYGRVEPRDGDIFVGYSLNWEKETPRMFNRKINQHSSVINAFLKVDGTMNPPYDNEMLMWFGQQVSDEGGILQLTLEVVSDLDALKDDIYDSLSKDVTKINTVYGTPVIIRYCHEMNGDWTQYGFKPSIYIDSFRLLTNKIRKRTNMTAMMWAPNVGIAYPFTPRPDSPSPPPTSYNDPYNQFKYLDTNKDNRLDSADDPYLPYYPGNEYVDWVGLSLYYYPEGTRNKVPSQRIFSDQLVGDGQTLNNIYDPKANRQLRNFYERFALGRATGSPKPLSIAESGAPYVIGLDGASELEVKRSWWEQTLNKSLSTNFPKLKMVVNFEERKKDVGESERDWAYGSNKEVVAKYAEFLQSGSHTKIVWGGKTLKFDCSGAVRYPKT